jgi:Zn-finger nucleic acid-binding protein
MKCPTDSTVLVMSERSGVEIDYCPTCRGVWLDRGELDKIIARAEAEYAAQAPTVVPPLSAPQADPRFRASDRRDDRDHGYGDRERGYGDRSFGNRDGYRGKKKESWLSELFD